MTSLVKTRGTLLDDTNFASAIYHLAQYHTEDGVLSVYLNLDETPGHLSRDTALNALLDPLHAHTKDAWLQGRLEYEIAGAVGTVQSWRNPPGRAVAMFFCGPGGLDTVIPLRFPVPALARFGRRPVLSPLISALDEHRRYCVVFIAPQRARIISIMLQEIEEDVTIESDVAGAGMRDPWHRDAAARTLQGDLHAHATRIIEHLWALDRSRPLHGLILAGDASALATLKRMLPSHLLRVVIEKSFDCESTAVGADIAQQVHQIEVRAREEEDRTLVARLLEERKSDLTVKGWEPTLNAINEGRVQIFLLADAGARAGVFCPLDHFVALRDAGSCPICGSELRPTEHVGEAAVRSVLLRGGQVHALAPEAAATLRRFGAGAVLRY